jgi:hypothetical protein
VIARVVCLLRRHKPITLIEELTPVTWLALPGQRITLHCTIDKTSTQCNRCGKGLS